MDEKFLKYYSRKDVQKKIVETAKEREVAVKFSEGFGKRPDILQYPNDVFEFAKRGAVQSRASGLEEAFRSNQAIDQTRKLIL